MKLLKWIFIRSLGRPILNRISPVTVNPTRNNQFIFAPRKVTFEDLNFQEDNFRIEIEQWDEYLQLQNSKIYFPMIITKEMQEIWIIHVPGF